MNGIDEIDILNEVARGVAVDEDGSVYVADSSNNRIVKWMVNATKGVVVAGGTGIGNRTDQFNIPGDMIRDKSGTLYVVDIRNHRIVCVPAGARNSITIAGGYGQGNASSQLDTPIYLAFDNEGSLYVSDENNYRIQKFSKTGTPPSTGGYVNTPSKLALAFGFLLLIVSSV
ncbi:unnamed protein product [Rotaria magnacalcarata]|uniref:Uncharacterized protein n=1 Tax=Rotaria magnacalcarata TaxID=392030 RepID=A0A814WAQ6_9BILA|nr:unnamed protein product [Rotaria magnacalcarata]CAF3922180.1 unnamed protein product [Rotaria magnacalcarata]